LKIVYFFKTIFLKIFLQKNNQWGLTTPISLSIFFLIFELYKSNHNKRPSLHGMFIEIKIMKCGL